jgi:hypothetical protein
MSSFTLDLNAIDVLGSTALASLEWLVSVVCVMEVFSLFKRETSRAAFAPLARPTAGWSVGMLQIENSMNLTAKCTEVESEL